jgi:hypothetical protein
MAVCDTTEPPETGPPESDREILFRAFKGAVLELERLAERTDRSAKAARETLERLQFERDAET